MAGRPGERGRILGADPVRVKDFREDLAGFLKVPKQAFEPECSKAELLPFCGNQTGVQNGFEQGFSYCGRQGDDNGRPYFRECNPR